MNFKKLILAISIAAFGCASPPKPVVVNNPPPPPVAVVPAPVPVVVPAPAPEVKEPVAPVDPLLIKGDNWSFRVPNEDWYQMDVSDEDGALGGVMNNKNQGKAILFGDELEVSVPQFTQFVFDSIKKIKGKISNVKKITINGNTFTYAEFTIQGQTARSWMTAKNGIGYIMMCGVPNEPKGQDSCKEIMNTLELQ